MIYNTYNNNSTEGGQPVHTKCAIVEGYYDKDIYAKSYISLSCALSFSIYNIIKKLFLVHRPHKNRSLAEFVSLTIFNDP
jgi:hypothetical protein